MAISNHSIVGLHENDPALYQSTSGFFAVLNREDEVVAAGPFNTQEAASIENMRLRSEGVRHAVVSYYPPVDSMNECWAIFPSKLMAGGRAAIDGKMLDGFFRERSEAESRLDEIKCGTPSARIFKFEDVAEHGHV